MRSAMTRREVIELVGAAAIAAGAWSRPGLAAESATESPTSADAMRGIFVILATPYTAAGAIDYDDLAAQVEWVADAGANGLVWPQNSSGYVRLSTGEIMRGMEVLTDANRGRPTTLVLGVQRDDTASMVELAAFAENLAPDMMIAMPPKVGTSLEDYREYYGALAGVTARPVILQTVPNLPGVEFRTELILELAEGHPHLGYVKEEAQPVFERISRLVGQPQIQRVYSAMRGRYLPYDLRLGVDGIISGMSMYADVFARLWARYRAEDWDGVREIHSSILLMLACEDAIPGAGRYVLQRRGIFRTTTDGNRTFTFSPTQIEVIEHNLKALEPYMVRPLAQRA